MRVEPFTPAPPTVPEAASGVVETISRLADDQLALTLARVRATALDLQIQVGLGIVAVTALLFSLVLLSAALVAGLATLMPLWSALLISGLVLAVVAGLAGYGAVKSQAGDPP